LAFNGSRGARRRSFKPTLRLLFLLLAQLARAANALTRPRMWWKLGDFQRPHIFIQNQNKAVAVHFERNNRRANLRGCFKIVVLRAPAKQAIGVSQDASDLRRPKFGEAREKRFAPTEKVNHQPGLLATMRCVLNVKFSGYQNEARFCQTRQRCVR